MHVTRRLCLLQLRPFPSTANCLQILIPATGECSPRPPSAHHRQISTPSNSLLKPLILSQKLHKTQQNDPKILPSRQKSRRVRHRHCLEIAAEKPQRTMKTPAFSRAICGPCTHRDCFAARPRPADKAR